jgi:hypothetical protein
MTRVSGEWWERSSAVALLVGCVLAALLTRAAVATAEQDLTARSQQLEELRALQSPGAGVVSPVDPCWLDGLFPHARLRWHEGAGGPFLQLQLQGDKP